MPLSNNESDAGAPNGHRTESGLPQPATENNQDAPKKQSKSILSKARQLWANTGITWPVYQLMFKGALAPTIAISAYQSTAWARQYTTVGYLVGIVTILSVVIQPRAKFVQVMLVQVLFVCLACCIALLACFCCVHARLNTEPFNGAGTGGPGTSGLASGGAETAHYNSSASAVAGIWLFAQVYVFSVIRARMPLYTMPCILWAIYANVSMTYAPQFNTMKQASAFAQHLLEADLTGMAIATGVSLFLFPRTSRKAVFQDMNDFLTNLKFSLQANVTYLNSMENTDMFAAGRTNTAGGKERFSAEALAFRARMRAVQATQAKLHTDLPFAKREVAIGKLGPDDLQQIHRLTRGITTPAVGLNCISDVFDYAAQERGWNRSVSFANVQLAEATNESDKDRINTLNEWHELIRLVKEPFGRMTDVINEGLEHAAITLQLTKTSKKSPEEDDREAMGDSPLPGAKDFTEYFDRRAQEFLKNKVIMLRGWAKINGIEIPEDFFSDPATKSCDLPHWMQWGQFDEPRRRLRRQLMVTLYMEFLLYTISRRVYELIVYADGLKESGKLSKTRIVVPGFKRLRKWFLTALWHGQDIRHDDDINTNDDAFTVHLGDAYKQKKDLEHLPPSNAFERTTNKLRNIAHFFASPASTFAFRVACATMCIAIVNYLRPTQVFFTTQRLFWAQIMTSIAMTPSAGQSLRTFVFRITGTASAMILSFIAYYIVDKHIAGILVFYFIFLHAGMYVLIKRPALAAVGQITSVTLTLIVGYELQVRKIGIQKATSNGQKYYPVYELGPTRLATVLVGLFLAWIWTIFPYPITEHSQMRKSVGSTLYLLANYYSVVHETVSIRLAGEEGDLRVKGSPGCRLEKSRSKIFSKCNVLLSGLRTQAGFVKFDIPVGGKFPEKLYEDITERLQSVLNFVALISVASTTFSELHRGDKKDHGSEWLHNFRKIVSEAHLTSQAITTLLSLLSSSIKNGQALPPYLKIPEPYAMSRRLEKLDSDILSVRHIAEPGYASFAVIQIGTRCLIEEMKHLLLHVKELVGELDFSYHIISTQEPSRNGSEENLVYTKSTTAEDNGSGYKQD